ncbi:hypothetical protein Tco_1103110 [Tanacetum coccineum]
MEDEHLDTIPVTESANTIKSSVEELVPTPSASADLSDDERECDVPVNDESSPTFETFSNPLFDSKDDFTSSDNESFSDEDIPKENFKIYSNPLFDEEIISTKIDPHCFNAESYLIESLLNRDTLIDSSPKFDYLLEEFSGELAHTDPIPPGVVDTDSEPEEEIRLAENLSYDNSSPRPPEERNSEIADTIVESLSPPPIPVEDSDSLMEEIDLFLASDDSMPPGIEIDDYDSEGDIRFLEELLSNDSPPLPENESFSLDHFDDPSLPRPPPEPPDVEICFNFEPDAGVVTKKVVGDNSKQKLANNTKKVQSIENKAKTVIFGRGSRGTEWQLCQYEVLVLTWQAAQSECDTSTLPCQYEIPIGCTLYKLVYGKSCHLPIELEHRAYWALKHANFDLKTAGDHRKLQLNELRDQAYENSFIYKERMKKLHDSKIKNRIFNVGDQVLLFNSRLKIFSGKLKTRWSGPFTITEVFPYGTAKLSHADGSNFKVNCHRLKHYFGGDTPPTVVPDLQTFPKDE